MENNPDLRLDQKSRMTELIGKVIVTYDEHCKNAEADINGYIEKLSFKVVNEDKNSLTILDNRSKQERTMRFADDCYLIEVSGMGFDEYYCRYDKPKEDKAMKKTENHAHHHKH